MNETAGTSQPPAINPEKWVEAYSDALYRYAFAHCKDRNVAEDLVQDTFIAALKSKHGFQNKSKELTWLTGILRNKLMEHFRSRKSAAILISDNSHWEEGDSENDAPFFIRSGAYSGHWTDEHAPTDWGNSTHRLLDFLEKCIALLPPKWHVVVREKFFQNRKTNEICSLIDISEKNYWVILHRTRLELRACIERELKHHQ